MQSWIDRRGFLGLIGAGGLELSQGASFDADALEMAWFTVDVTPPKGHPCMGGGIQPVQTIEDPLEARGLILRWGRQAPVAMISVDWCEIRHTAHDAWRSAIAAAIGSSPERILVSSVHQHDAPVADLRAEEILREAKSRGSVCNPDFHATIVARVAAGAKTALNSPVRVTGLKCGRAPVERIASNRRYLDAAGTPRFDRGSATRDAFARQAPEGTIDPNMAVLHLEGAGGKSVALFTYSTHPMSYYGKGAVSADFIGLARRGFSSKETSVFPLYFSGCSGNVTAGKFNDGQASNRPVLARALEKGMHQALQTAEACPLTVPQFRSIPFSLPSRQGGRFDPVELKQRLASERSFDACLAALGLSCRERLRRPLDLPVVDFGKAAFCLAPAESYVEFQLFAQSQRPGAVVLTAGYGECAPGYIPTEQAWKEKDTNLGDWCWVNPGSEAPYKEALALALKAQG